MCLTKNTNAQHFKTTAIFIFSKYVHCDMQVLVEIISAMLCFLDGFGIAVQVFSGHQSYNDCTRQWPTIWYKII